MSKSSVMEKRIVVFLAILLVSCGNVPLTPEARLVRKIQPDWANTCKLISMEEINSTNGYSPADCQNKAFYLMLNRVAEMGGNAYVITHESVSPCLTGGTTLTFEAYKCSGKENVPNTESTTPPSNTLSTEDNFSKLKTLKSMKDRGIISDDEFSKKKKEILDRM